MKMLRKVNVTGLTGELYFLDGSNDRNDIPYDIFNLQGRDLVPVGLSLPSGSFEPNGHPIVWPGDTQTPPSGV